MTYRALMERVITTYGWRAQVNQAVNELAGLINAIEMYRLGVVDAAAVIDKLAEVQIMAMQLSIIFGEENVTVMIRYKLANLSASMKERGV